MNLLEEISKNLFFSLNMLNEKEIKKVEIRTLLEEKIILFELINLIIYENNIRIPPK